MDEKDFVETQKLALEALEYLDKASSSPIRSLCSTKPRNNN